MSLTKEVQTPRGCGRAVLVASLIVALAFTLFVRLAGADAGHRREMIVEVAGASQNLQEALDVSRLVERYVDVDKRNLWAHYMAVAAVKNKMDVLLIAAVAYVESRWTNPKRNKTRDYGVMQVHWQPREPWLRGISRKELMVPSINIEVGVEELVHVRAWCKRKGHKRSQHHWVAHYQAGPNVKHRKYSRAVLRVYRKLRRVIGKR